jgi:hypothetical protein
MRAGRNAAPPDSACWRSTGRRDSRELDGGALAIKDR